ncbi:MAG: mannose-phosphate guanylyltransferase [Patescibacteria group bacterium]|nr:mannose-phosphate guanylyltransferase [Patescibacteria group bacterium]
MITVIIAGGSGSRLWPLSTPDYPKHLLALNGSGSLLQNTYARAKRLSSKIYVIPEVSHAHHVKEQLPDLPDSHFIVEPARRGTASCIVAGLERIARDNDSDEPIAFMAADHYIRDVDGFAHSFKVAARVSKREGRIVQVGAEPDYPATGFGYIEKGDLFDEDAFIFDVKQFKEKPTYEVARGFLKSGKYLWNCGYFVGSVDTFLKAMKQYAPKLHQEYEALKSCKTAADYEKTYLGFENIAIDYALIEKVEDLLVAPAAFDWMDLGSFGDLHKAVESDQNGNHTTGGNVELEDVENSYVRNDEGRPVAVIGLDNVAVINTANGILVTRKDLAQKVGDISKRFKK